MIKKPIKKKLEENIAILKKELGADESFDVLVRNFEIGRKKAVLFFIFCFI